MPLRDIGVAKKKEGESTVCGGAVVLEDAPEVVPHPLGMGG